MKNNSEHKRHVVGEWQEDNVPAYWCWLYVAGNMNEIEIVCRKFVFPNGVCVTIEPLKYVFAGGAEEGARIGFIQYVPFVEQDKKILEKAKSIGKLISENNFQWSFSIIDPYKSYFFSRRRE